MQQKTRGWWRSHRWQRATMLRGILAIIIDAVVHEMPFLPQGRSTHQSCHWQPQSARASRQRLGARTMNVLHCHGRANGAARWTGGLDVPVLLEIERP